MFRKLFVTYVYLVASISIAAGSLEAANQRRNHANDSVVEYSVRVDDSNALQAEATLLLPPGNGQPRALVLYGVGRGLQTQVSDVRGDEVPLAMSEKGRWLAPANCRTVTWTIHFQDSAAAPIQAASQQCVFLRDQRWWLISESTALLRLEGQNRESTIRLGPKDVFHLGAMPSGQDRWRIPAPGQAPEFFVVGHAKSQQKDIDGFRVFYVADNAQRIEHLGMQDRHTKAFRYLVKLFPQSASVPAAEKRLMIVWIGVDADSRYIGGASGSRSFIANYVYGDPERNDDYIAASLMVVAHEQFHQLTALCIQPETSLPTWVNEGLAQYYGLKSLSHCGLSLTTVARARDRFIDPERTVVNGLAELSRRFNQGDRSVYPLFYSQGSTFWFEIDQAVQQESRGEQSLDGFLPALFRTAFDKQGTIPESLLGPLRNVIGDRLDGLVQKYVGS